MNRLLRKMNISFIAEFNYSVRKMGKSYN